MAGMYELISYDGYVFADHGWTIAPMVENGLEVFAQNANYIQGGSARPRFASITRQSRTFTWQVVFRLDSSIETQFRDLRRVLRFDKNDGAERALIVEREDGTQMTIDARPRSLIRAQRDGGIGVVYDLTFESGATWWQSVIGETAVNVGPDVGGGSVSTTLDVGGEVHARPVVRLFPLKEKTAGLGATALPVIVTENSGYDLVKVPHTITFDHAAAVTAGKSTSGGTDILVTVDGLAVNRSVTGANTSSCRVTFPLTVDANDSVEVVISYAPSGQVYGGASYAQDWARFIVSEQAGVALTSYPYRLDFDHAAKVTASRSKSSGADIRVWVDGIEIDRAISGANTSTCKVWAKLDLAANGTSVVCITTAASGYDYGGGTYTPGNGAVDLSTSSNGIIIYTTPVISNNDDSPLALKPILTHINAVSNPTNYQVANVSGTDPGIKASIMDISSPAQNGNYVRFYAGGLRLFSLAAKYTNRNGASTVRSRSFMGQSSDLATWSAVVSLSQNLSDGSTLYQTNSFSSGTVGAIAGVERASGTTEETGTSNRNYTLIAGSGSSELTLTLVSADVPTNSALTAPTDDAGTASTPYIFNGILSDGTRSIAITNAKISQLAGVTNLLSQPLAFDNAAWTKTHASVTANDAANPVDGTTNADKLVEDSTAGVTHFISQGVSISQGGAYKIAIWGKASERDTLTITVVDNPFSAGVFARFNLSTGAIVDAAQTFSGDVFSDPELTVSDAHSDYRRGILSFTVDDSVTALSISFELYNGSNTYNGDGSSGLYLYEALLYHPDSILGPGIEIDCENYQALYVDVEGHTTNSLGRQLRKTLAITSPDENWLSAEPDTPYEITWAENNMDADGMALRVTVADRWH